MAIKDLLNNSVVILNKPPKLSSHEVSVITKQILGVSKSGHAGTLDPQVSGVLIVALGRATKLLQFITKADKTYVCIIKFKNILAKTEILSLFEKFTGTITQTPPKESAVRKVARKRHVFYIKFLEQSKENPRLVLFETKVEAGTYIRTLCDDIGKICGGARMEELRRVKSGSVGETKAITLQQLKHIYQMYLQTQEDKQLLKVIKPPEFYIDFPKVMIKNSALKSISNGAQIMFPAIKDAQMGVKKNNLVYLCDEQSKFFGVGTSLFDYAELPKKQGIKGLAVNLERVHI
ncbi:MAG: RNA-guided pseudouridylation complex pseudouridine synthase subunit Cbf5 [Candidatus Micrarchaeota archaeon]